MTIIRQIKLRRWFPAHDEFAACVLRLCILREDFTLELQAIHASSIESLDKHSATWRRLYFYRKMVGTLFEIRRALQCLLKIAEWQQLLEAGPPKWRTHFIDLVKKLEEDRQLIKDTRNMIGGHVLQKGVAQVLKDMEHDAFSYLEVGAKKKQTHYVFAGEITARMLVTDVPEAKRNEEIERRAKSISRHLPVSNLIDIIFTMYVDSRKLAD